MCNISFIPKQREITPRYLIYAKGIKLSPKNAIILTKTRNPKPRYFPTTTVFISFSFLISAKRNVSITKSSILVATNDVTVRIIIFMVKDIPLKYTWYYISDYHACCK